MPSSHGYSGTPLPKKLGLRPGSRLMVLAAPEDFMETLGPLPDAVVVRKQARGEADVITVFVDRRSELERRFPVAHRRLAKGGGLWICWPKKSSGRQTDLSDAVVREIGLASGLVDNKVCAVDATWSALRFVRRRSG